ncbi:MAG TPA: aminoglycoside phosphotransferase family protein [Candidatus Paceibacterota bacterium]|nr:aminoglycoside phosphotransferase family protein [Candidatus Paceibacterota bacterium]
MLNPKLLDQGTVVAYFKDREIFSPESSPLVEILTGGVSNVVLAVSGEGKDLVLKQALPELKVASEWIADQRRAIVEAHAIEVLHKLTPENVPKLYDVDPDQFILIIERAPRTMTIWKEDLLSGSIQPDIAAHLGQILGLWHRNTAKDPAILQEFQEDSLFEQLRISPFYRTVATKHESISKRIGALITELLEDKPCLVHGDYSPKNILVDGRSKVIVLDFEVAHTGNPVFDLGFLLAHLLCKYEFFQEQDKKILLAQAADAFVQAYEKSSESPVSASLPWHVAAIALARVDGQSPVGYLDSAAQDRLRRRALTILQSETPPTITEIFSQA